MLERTGPAMAVLIVFIAGAGIGRASVPGYEAQHRAVRAPSPMKWKQPGFVNGGTQEGRRQVLAASALAAPDGEPSLSELASIVGFLRKRAARITRGTPGGNSLRELCELLRRTGLPAPDRNLLDPEMSDRELAALLVAPPLPVTPEMNFCTVGPGTTPAAARCSRQGASLEDRTVTCPAHRPEHRRGRRPFVQGLPPGWEDDGCSGSSAPTPALPVFHMSFAVGRRSGKGAAVKNAGRARAYVPPEEPAHEKETPRAACAEEASLQSSDHAGDKLLELIAALAREARRQKRMRPTSASVNELVLSSLRALGLDCPCPAGAWKDLSLPELARAIGRKTGQTGRNSMEAAAALLLQDLGA